jgi:hypothetical protein
LNIADVFPRLATGTLDQNFSQLNLTSRAQLLRDKIKALRQTNRAPQETLHQIENHLNAISQERNLMGQWSHYELAYEGFIFAASLEDLVGVVLNLRSCTQVLDLPSQEIWSKQKLGQIELDVRSGHVNGTTREEISSLARSIYDCGFRFVRNSDLKSRVMRSALFLNVFFSLVIIVLLVLFQLGQIPSTSAWQTLLISCLGASGALLRATIRFRQIRLDPDDLRIEPLFLLFRAAFGAILAIVVTLFLQLRVVDFPYLHTGPSDSTPFAPTALYVFAFASGFAEQSLFAALEKFGRKRAYAEEQNSAPSEPGEGSGPTNL